MKKLTTATALIFICSVTSGVVNSAEILGVKVPGTKQESIPIPKVAHHKLGASTSEIQDICEKRAEEDELPCYVINQGNSICYAYVDLKGVSEEVQCFIKVEESYVGN
jgi:hypothetical protein